MGLYSDDFLRTLRNKIKIDRVIDILGIETRYSKDIRRFSCPLCQQFHTATKSKTNLARCFDCETNFNPIDFVMAATRRNFVETVEFLIKQIDDTKINTN